MKKKIRKFENYLDYIADLLLFIWFTFFFLVLELGYMQITHQAYYTDKFSKSYEKTVVKQGSVRGQIYDASGKPLVENKGKQVLYLYTWS